MTYTPWRIPGKTPSGPFDFYAMTGEQADSYLRDFIESVPERIKQLEAFVASTEGFQSWRAGGSAESFEVLGHWVREIADRQPLSAEEGEAIRKLQGDSQFAKEPLPETRWDDLSLSVFADIGIYWCESLRRSNPQLRWDRRRAKNETGENQPVIVFGKNSDKSPFEIGDVFAGSIVRGSKDPTALRKFFEYWTKSATIITEREARERMNTK